MTGNSEFKEGEFVKLRGRDCPKYEVDLGAMESQQSKHPAPFLASCQILARLNEAQADINRNAKRHKAHIDGRRCEICGTVGIACLNQKGEGQGPWLCPACMAHC